MMMMMMSTTNSSHLSHDASPMSSGLSVGMVNQPDRQHQEYIEARRLSLMERETTLKNLTDDAYKQVETFISIASRLEESESQKVKLINENRELRENLSFQIEEHKILKKEYRKCLEYIEELHQNLKEKIEDIAMLEMECEKFRIEMLAGRDNSNSNLRASNDSAILQTNTRDNEKVNNHLNVSKWPNSAFSRVRANDKSRESIKRIEQFRERANILISNEREDSDKFPLAITEEEDNNSGLASNDKLLLHYLMHSQSNSALVSSPAMLPALDPSTMPEADYLRWKLKEKEIEMNLLISRVKSFVQMNKSGQIELSADGLFPDNSEQRDKSELLRVIRRHLEEKISWQAYAETLLKRIILCNPELLNIKSVRQNADQQFDDMGNSEIAVWRELALSLVQKLIAHAPSLLASTEIAINANNNNSSTMKPSSLTILGNGSVLFANSDQSVSSE